MLPKIKLYVRISNFIFALVIACPLLIKSQVNNSNTMNTKRVNIGDRKINLTTLSKKETKQFIDTYFGKENALLSKKYNSMAYILNDGRLLLSHEGGGALYESPNDLEDLMKFLNKNTKSHPLVDGIPYNSNYLEHVEDVIAEFASNIGLESGKLDKSLESLKLIETKIKELKLDEFEIEKKYLVYLMTYSGEIIRTKVNGTWTLNKLMIEGKLVYEPSINLNENQREYSPLWPIYKELQEHPNDFSFMGVVEAEIEKYKILDLIKKDQK